MRRHGEKVWTLRYTGAGAFDVARRNAPRDADDVIGQAKRLIDRGLKCILINTGSPPAGLSPAASGLDPHWALMAEQDVPVLNARGVLPEPEGEPLAAGHMLGRNCLAAIPPRALGVTLNGGQLSGSAAGLSNDAFWGA